MNILILDPASTTGYVVASFNKTNKTLDIKHWDYIDIDPDAYVYDGDRYLSMYYSVMDLIDKHKIDVVGVEDYFFSRKSSQGATLNCSYRASIHMACRQKKIHYDIINITLWKKFVNGGTSRPTKEQKIKWGKEASKKLMTQESLWKTWNIKFPNHSLSPKTGKPVKFKYDVVDAVGMAIFYASIHLHAKQIKYSVIINKDIVYKKQPKGIFNYGGIDV